MNNHNDANIIVWEAALEASRRTSLPDAVSRLECVFACRDLQNAVAFRDRFRPGYTVYSVCPVDSATPISVGDYSAITNARVGPFVDVASEISSGYWLTNNPQSPELLIGGPVQITGAVA